MTQPWDDKASQLVWALSRPPVCERTPLAESGPPPDPADADLVLRVTAAYRTATAVQVENASFWHTLTRGVKQDVHKALVGDDPARATEVLRRPDQNTHFYGFDAVSKPPPDGIEPHELVFRNLDGSTDWKNSYALWLHDTLVSLAEAIGATRVFYPETEPGLHYRLFGKPIDADAVLDSIERVVGHSLDFPNPYAGEVGIQTRRGIAGFRSFQAVYQAWRIRQLVRSNPAARVLEIGAGLGRTAYYANKLGVRDYTIVDIPLSGAAQGYYLGRVLNSDAISLYGEARDEPRIKILPPESLATLNGRYDLVLNVDSFTEMDGDAVDTYWRFARERSSKLLSINHELNPHPVRNVYAADPSLHWSRHPYWMRRGYVEELIEFG